MFHFKKTTKQENKLSFIHAMEKEVSDHKERDHWTVVHCKTLPKNSKPLKAIWSFKQSQNPDGDFMKHKSHIFAHSGMQQWGKNHWGKYFPVVTILRLRIILETAKIHNLDSKAIDFALALPQEELEEDAWTHLKIGFQVDIHPIFLHTAACNNGAKIIGGNIFQL